jgi:hypothetical protein
MERKWTAMGRRWSGTVLHGLAAVALVALLASTVHAAPAGGAVNTADPVSVAGQGLKNMSGMANKDTYASLGFKSLDEVGKAKLGTAVKVYMIQYDQLKALDPAADPKTVLRDLDERMFPVYVGGAVRAAISVRLDAGDKQWKVVSLGDPATVLLFDEARGLHAKANAGTREYFLIRIPAIYQIFLGFTDGTGKMHFITMHEHKDIGGHKGEARPARTVLDLLTMHAKNTKVHERPTK